MGYGWRGRIGLVIPSSNTTMESEFWRMAPNGVSVHVGRMFVSSSPSTEREEALHGMLEYTMRAVEDVGTAGVNVVVFGCTVGSFLFGLDFERDLTRKIEEKAKLPTITTSEAVVEALRVLNARRIVMATPYDERTTQKEKVFLEANGFTVLKTDFLNLRKNIEVGWLTPDVAYKQARKIFVPEADALFISCTNYRTIELIKTLEKDLERPVVTSTQASMWATLKKLGIKEEMTRYGALLERYLHS